MIAVLGDIAVDIVSTLRAPLTSGSDAPAQIRIMPGGSGANVAVWLARLGQDVTMIGRVGNDAFGRWLSDDLTAEGVLPGLIIDNTLGTGVIQVLVEPDGERTMVPDRGANAGWRAEEVAEMLIADADLLHIVGYVLLDRAGQTGALAAMRYARRHRVPISLDPSSHAPLLGMGQADFWDLVGKIDILLPNRDEAFALTGLRDPTAALPILRQHTETIAIKLDRDGCVAAVGTQRVRVPASTIPIVNATGAGDAFDAAFLAAIQAGTGLATACRAAVALGTYAATLATTR